MSAADVSNGSVRRSNMRAWLRLCAFLLLGVAELAGLDSVYDVRAAAGGEASLAWLGVNLALKTGAYAALYAGIAFLLMIWPRRANVAADLGSASAGPHAWGMWSALNIALFAALLVATPMLRGVGAPWAAFVGWAGCVALMLALLAPAAAPLLFWRDFVRAHARTLGIAALIGVAVALAALASQNSWDALAGATLQAAYALVRLFDPSAFMDLGDNILGAGAFRVRIDAYCSGYEGVGLVLAALGVYVYAFRSQLRFPNIYLLFPIGAAAILTLNVVRIAALVALGAHVSPDFALKGFHSQAGWIAFVTVTGALMALAHQSRFFRTEAGVRQTRTQDASVTLAIALLSPFALLMAARIAAAMGQGAHWLGVVVAMLPLAAVVHYRDVLRRELGRINWEPIAIGLAVGALWIATQPASEDVSLQWWLMAQPPFEASVWVLLRVLGFALIVPIAEELVFRGYLHRALVRRRFDEAEPAAFSWPAFLLTSLLFGAMHGRWVAGALAGAAFAFALYRSRSLTGPIAAHAAANGLIAIWAIAMQDWALL